MPDSYKKKERINPFKERLIEETKEQIAYLVKRFGHISCTIHNSMLALNLDDLLRRMQFKTSTEDEEDQKMLLRHIALSLHKKHMVLLQYRSTHHDTGDLISILRSIKNAAPSLSFESLLPILSANYSSHRQQEIFQSLGCFGVKQVIFLTPGASLERNMEEVIESLGKYANLLISEENGKEIEDIRNAEESAETKQIKKYYRYIEQGRRLEDAGEFEKAIGCYTEAINLNPGYDILMKRGNSYYKNRQFIPALHDFKSASILENSAPEPYTRISTCCFLLVKDDIKNKRDDLARKRCAVALKYLKEARNIVEELISRNAHTPERLPPAPYQGIISALVESDLRGSTGLDEERGRIDAYTKNLMRKVANYDEIAQEISIDARLDLATLYARTSSYEKAERIFRQVIVEAPEYAVPAFNNYAVELRKNGQDEKAYHIYLELLDNKGEIPERGVIIDNMITAGLSYAYSLREGFHHEKAIKLYKNLLSFQPPEKEWILCELAVTYLEAGNKQEASYRFLEALFINPHIRKQSRFNRYRTLQKLKEFISSTLQDEE